jgi:hypothetical protein
MLYFSLLYVYGDYSRNRTPAPNFAFRSASVGCLSCVHRAQTRVALTRS